MDSLIAATRCQPDLVIVRSIAYPLVALVSNAVILGI